MGRRRPAQQRPTPPPDLPVMTIVEAIAYSRALADERGDNRAVFRQQDLWRDVNSGALPVGQDAFWVPSDMPRGGYWVITVSGIERRIRERLLGRGRRPRRKQRSDEGSTPHPSAVVNAVLGDDVPSPADSSPAVAARNVQATVEKEGTPGEVTEVESPHPPVDWLPAAMRRPAPAEVLGRIAAARVPELSMGRLDGDVPEIIQELYAAHGCRGVLNAVLSQVLVDPHVWPTLRWIADQGGLPADIGEALQQLAMASTGEQFNASAAEATITQEYGSDCNWDEASQTWAARPDLHPVWPKVIPLATVVHRLRQAVRNLMVDVARAEVQKRVEEEVARVAAQARIWGDRLGTAPLSVAAGWVEARQQVNPELIDLVAYPLAQALSTR